MSLSSAFVISGLIGTGTLATCLLATNWLTRSSDRFSVTLNGEHQELQGWPRFVRALGKTFGWLSAPFADMGARLDQDLTYAGRPYGGIDGKEYLAAAIALSCLAGLALGTLVAMLRLTGGADPLGIVLTILRVAIILTPLALVYFVMDIRSLANRNSTEIEREFPFFLDLAILVVQAGGTPRQALRKFVECSPGTPLSREIAVTAKDADATSFADALGRLVDRLRPKSVKTILKNLAQGEKSSGQLEEFYTEQAKELRYLRDEMASRTAERLKANIAFPVFLMMFSVIIVALTPTIVSIRSQGLF